MTTNKRKRKRSRSPARRDTEIEFLEFQMERRSHLHTVLKLFSFFFITLGLGADFFFYLLRKWEKSEWQRFLAKNKELRVRPTWKKENERISDRMFYRLFRMKRPCFNALCDKIEEAVGREKFQSEAYLNELRSQGHTNKVARMYNNSIGTNGEYIPGEVKVAMTLRILAGASYLDMFLWFNVNADHVRAISRRVMREWICNDAVIPINFHEGVLQDPRAIARISREFGAKSNGVMDGCIGALDGWLVKIRCPRHDEVKNPGKYFSRKGFYAINVQVIVDRKKRVLWRYIGEKGSSHDSRVFNESGLGANLLEMATILFHKGLYIIGDSAYAIRSYLLTPYDNAKPGSAEDAFNFYLSSKRIYVECAFGEIDRRWGIFWRPLEGSLKGHQDTIDAALRLHNYIVDYREQERNGDNNDDYDDEDELNQASENFMRRNPLGLLGTNSEESVIVSGQNVENGGRRRGRPTTQVARCANSGRQIRKHLCDALRSRNLIRPVGRKYGKRDRHNRVTEQMV